VRAAIVRDLRGRVEGSPSFREIAAQHGVSLTFVRNVANKELGPGVALATAQAQTKDARASFDAVRSDRRRRIAERLLDFAENCLDELDAGSVIAGISFGDVVSGRARGVTARDRQALATAAAIALDKERMLSETSSDNDSSDVRQFLRWVTNRPLTDQ
jgi:hypothetical protein